MNPDTLNLILGDVLAACATAYAQTGAPNAPARMFQTHGQPIVEGEQLTVSTLGISTVHPFPLAQLRAVRTVAVGSAGVSIEVWRSCWPAPEATSHASKNLPDPGKLTAAAQILQQDAATLWGWLAQQITQGTLIPSIPTIRDAADVSMSPMVALGPQGLLAGWRFPIAVKLSTVVYP